MTKDIERKPFQQTSHTGLLIAFLAPIAQSGDFRVITHTELSEVAHVPEIQKSRHYLTRAVHRVLRDHHKLFIPVTGVGIKLATDEEAANVLRDTRDHIRRSARRGRERSSVITLDKLSNAQRLAYLANEAIVALFEKSSRPIVAKRIEAAIEKTGPKSFEAQELMRLTGVKSVD